MLKISRVASNKMECMISKWEGAGNRRKWEDSINPKEGRRVRNRGGGMETGLRREKREQKCNGKNESTCHNDNKCVCTKLPN